MPDFKKISDTIWEIPKTYQPGMLVPVRFYATEKLMNSMEQGVIEQISNVACLPGIQKYAYCMPDGHRGYGFPIGGVAAFDVSEGVISPGGIGFDINCGMRMMVTNLMVDEVQPKLKDLVHEFYRNVPAGVGCKGFLKINRKEFREVMIKGAKWCIEQGYGWSDDLQRIEDYGEIDGANPDVVSDRAVKRGLSQLGTLGSGNHYLEVQVVKDKNIFNREIAEKFGIIGEGQIVIMFHCGSRGFGHQIASDYLQLFLNVMPRYGLEIKDKELASAPFESPEGQDYYSAMACAANMAFANRQIITHQIRGCMERIYGRNAEQMGLHLVYDVTHNIAKVEEYEIDGVTKTLVVHRKGATRSFGPGNPALPPEYRETGQPVILGGSMETGSYLLVGTKKAEEETFGSTAHGSGRVMSRHKAKKMVRGDQLQKDLEAKGIYIEAASRSGLAEEAGVAYKDIDEVVEAVHQAGLSKKVVKLEPIGNVKG